MKEVILSAVLAAVTISLAETLPDDLVFYTTFDSASAVKSPQVGNEGNVYGAAFVDGVFGKALSVPALTCAAEFPMPNGIPVERGCIEFWAKILNSADYFLDAGDPTFFQFLNDGSTSEITLEYNANNGNAQSGLYVMGYGTLQCIQNDYWRGSLPYTSVLPDDPKGWHHYAVSWNTNGVNQTSDLVQVFVDGKKFMSTSLSKMNAAKIENVLGSASHLRFSRDDKPTHGKSPFLIDEFRIWSTDKTEFDFDPLISEGVGGDGYDDDGDIMVSEVTAKQHYPWCGKIDISYRVSGRTAGLGVKIVVRDTIGCINYEAKTFDVKPTATKGLHTVVWNATADGVKKGSSAMVATVSLIVSE